MSGVLMSRRLRKGAQVAYRSARLKDEKPDMIATLLEGPCRDIAQAKTKLDEKLGPLTPSKIDDLTQGLFGRRVWKDYDSVMREHEAAIEQLLRVLFSIDRAQGNTIFGERAKILDACGGTGTVEQIVSRIVGQFRFDRMDSTIVDFSKFMTDSARSKLRGKVRTVEHNMLTDEAIPVHDGFDVAILSQALPFLFDRSEKIKSADPEHVRNANAHKVVRMRVLQKLVDKLHNDGHLIIIDETPMKYSLHGNKPAEILRQLIFEITTDLVNKGEVEEIVRGLNTGGGIELQFAADVTVPIDGKHDMYVMVFRKKANIEVAVVRNDSRYETARSEARRKVVEIYRRIDADITGGKIHFPAIGDIVEISDLNAVAGYRGNGSVALVDVIHRINNGNRVKMLEGLVEQIPTGKALIIVDEFPTARGEEFPGALSTSQFRGLMSTRFGNQMVQVGAVANPISSEVENIMIGYEFRKI